MRLKLPLGAIIALAAAAHAAGAQGSISGVVFDSLSTRAPLANATVVLVEKSRYATTDARGLFRFDSVADGHYTLGFTHDVLDSLDLEAPTVGVDVAAGRSMTVGLATPSAATVYAQLCRGARDEETGVIIGRVRDVDAKTPLGGATISTDWVEFTLVGGQSQQHRVPATAKTNASGVYLLCGVPTKTPLQLITQSGTSFAGPVMPAPDGRVIRRADFALSMKDNAALVAPTGEGVAKILSVRGTATLHGTALDADGKPLKGAVVGVIGTADSARTDSRGEFKVEHIPAGTRTVELRSIGFTPTSTAIDFATNGTSEATLTVRDKAQTLTPVAVAGKKSNSPWMDASGFGTRRDKGLGAYMTQDDISQHNYFDLASVLRGMRGITVECVATRIIHGVPCSPMPELISISDYGRGVRCTPNYFVDAVQIPVDGAGPPSRNPFSDLSAMVPPGSIKGIEVYSNPGTMPAQFDRMSSSGCGSIVIWTH